MSLALCQKDAYLRTLDTEVLECAPTPEGLHRVVLAETILYPTGGGQPNDTGTIGASKVVDVFKEKGVGVVHLVRQPIPRGQVRVEVDWTRRYDHMQQHTGQHLLTAVANDRFGWATTSFHLGVDYCSIDLDTDQLPADAMAKLEQVVNAEIRAGRKVSHRLVSAEVFESLPVRTRGLPEGFTGAVRLVEIEGLDLNTCGGTHVASTAELQVLKLVETQRAHGQTRLVFLVGDRVLARMEASLVRERELTRLLATGVEEHVEQIGRLQTSARDAQRKAQQLQGELARFLGKELAEQAGPIFALHRPGVDLNFLGKVATALHAEVPDAPALLTTGDGDEGAGLFLMIGPSALVKEAGPPVASLLEGRGGGPPGRYQGKAGRLENRQDALDLMKQIARSHA